MITYRLYDLVLEADCEFPELEPATGRPDLTLALGSLAPLAGDWEDLWSLRDGEPWVQMQRVDAAYRIRYVDQVEFEYGPAQHRVVGDARQCSAATFRHFFLDQIAPLILGLDALVLHASAVVMDDRVVAFLGRAGAGKSTLTALLERRGHAAAADDALRIWREGETLVGVPPYRGLRLWPDALAMLAGTPGARPERPTPAKVRIRTGLSLDDRVRPLQAAFVLDASPTGDIAIDPLRARERALALIEHSFCLDRREGPRLVAHLERVCAAARDLPMWRLRYPRQQDCWPALVDAIEAHTASVSTDAPVGAAR